MIDNKHFKNEHWLSFIIKFRLIFISIFLFACCLAANAGYKQGEQRNDEKPRLLVLTDIGGDPDDEQSLRRLLVYANEFRIEGFVATATRSKDDNEWSTKDFLIHDAINDYALVRDNLLLHAEGYPAAEYLRTLVFGGSVKRGVQYLSPGLETPGSRHILETADASDEVLHIVIWGGAHDLAQALLDLKMNRSQEEINKLIAKLRIVAIADQDFWFSENQIGTGEWIRQNFPDLRYVESGPSIIHRQSAQFRGMYQNDSRGGPHATLPLVRPYVELLNNKEWVNKNVTVWGPIGAGYPPEVNQNPGTNRNTSGVKEGDTPSWFFVLPHGLNDAEHPEWGGWGGRFQHQSGEYYSDAQDNHWSGVSDGAVRRKWTVARWREAFQNDFAARMRWCLLPFGEANHNPVARIEKDDSRSIITVETEPGQTVSLDASGSYDPDGDDIGFDWWVYHEPSSATGILNSNGPVAEIYIPDLIADGDIHIILEVRDNGTPQLFSFRRVIVKILN